MTAAVFQDLRKGIISNVLILFGFLGGAVFQLIRLGGSGLILFFGSAVFPVLLFSILYYFRMIGAGDIKLLAALGGFLGISDLFRCLVCALIFGGILSLFLMIYRKNLIRRFQYLAGYVSSYIQGKEWQPYRRKGEKDGEFPLSVPIALSVWFFAAAGFKKEEFMKKSIFAVCDLEASYAYNLMEAIDERQGMSFEVQAFTNVESLISYARERHIELLLISAAAMCGELLKLSIGKIMILSEGEKKKELSDYPCIYKYQASDQLIAEVMNYYAVEAVPAPAAMLKKKVEIIGIYSPVGRSLKTSLALTYGQIRAREHKVLYLNLEEYAGFETLLEEKYEADLADLLYFARLGSGNLVYRMGSLIRHLGGLDYIPPGFLSRGPSEHFAGGVDFSDPGSGGIQCL